MWADDNYSLNDIYELVKEVRKVYRVHIELVSDKILVVMTNRGYRHSFNLEKPWYEYPPTYFSRYLVKFIRDIGGEEMKKEPGSLVRVLTEPPVFLKYPQYKQYTDSTGAEYHGGKKDGSNN